MRPPHHSIDGEAVYILPHDSAWAHDRIDRESEGLSKNEAKHPFQAYMDGTGRYDLDAKHTWRDGSGSAADYLEGKPTRFVLRKIGARKRARIRDRLQREVAAPGPSAYSETFFECIEWGVASIEGDPDLEFNPLSDGRVPEAILDKIEAKFGQRAIILIGNAAWLNSQPLSDAEKKP